MSLGPAATSVSYSFTVIGFILVVLMTILTVTLFIQSSVKRLDPRILLHLPPKMAPTIHPVNTSIPGPATSGFSSNIYVSPFDGILH